jgi:hypothetical protein
MCGGTKGGEGEAAMSDDHEVMCKLLWSMRTMQLPDMRKRIEHLVRSLNLVAYQPDIPIIVNDMADIVRFTENYETFASFFIPMAMDGVKIRKKIDLVIDGMAAAAGARRASAGDRGGNGRGAGGSETAGGNEMTLLDCLRAEFGSDRFDATDAWARSTKNPQLEAALDAEVPRLHYRSGYKIGRMNTQAIRMALRRLPGFRAELLAGNYWQFYVVLPPRA